jgi:hypothetical protein
VPGDVHLAAGPAVQCGVVEQVVHEQPQALSPAADRAAGERFLEGVADAGMPAPGGVDSGVEQVVELDVLARQALGGLAAGQRLQTLEHVDGALAVPGGLADERGALGGSEARVASQRIEVGAHAGQRRAQLVAGVGTAASPPSRPAGGRACR